MSRDCPRFGHYVVVGLAALAAACSLPLVPGGEGRLQVTLIAFNDFHGYLDTPTGTVRIRGPEGGGAGRVPAGGVEYLTTLAKALAHKNPNHAVVAAGDLIGASPLNSSLLRHEPTIEALSALGLEVSSVGNHEFDRGPAELRRMQEGGCHPQDDCSGRAAFSGAKFRYLAANVVDASSGRTFFRPYFIKRFESVPVAFIGVVVRDTPALVGGSMLAGLVFGDEADAVNALVPELRRLGVEAIVVLIHEGGVTHTWYDDPRCPGFRGAIVGIVKRLDPAVDLVVSGHSHNAYICRVGGRLVTQAGSYGRFLTEIDLTLDRRSGEVVAANARNHVVDTTRLERDPAATAIVQRARATTMHITGRPIASLAVVLSRSGSRAGESALGDVIADALLAAAAAPDKGGAQIAMMNPGGIRADLVPREGILRHGDLHNALPFRNAIVVMDLSGDEIRKLLEQQWSESGNVVHILQVSRGFSYAWDGARAIGNRVVQGSIQLSGEPVEPGRTYRVAVNSYMADGGDSLSVLRTGRNRVRGPLTFDAVADYLRSHPELRVPEGGRIRRVN